MIATKLKARLFQPITVKRIAILGFLLALLVVLKWAFRFVPGIEAVSFCFITFALFLPFFDLVLLVICFNLLVVATHGIGAWWVAYWVLWPLISLMSKIASLFTRNRYVFGIIGFLAGPMVMFVYFFSDMIFFDSGYAVMNLITAIPVNMIEGLTTMIMVIVITPRILKIVSQVGSNFWSNERSYTFKPTKYKIFNIIATSIITLGSIAGITLMFIYNSFFINWKFQEVRKDFRPGVMENDNSVPDHWGSMGYNKYNTLYNSLGEHQVGIVIIANGNVIQEAVDIYDNESIDDALKDIKSFKFHMTPTYMGNFVGSYSLNGSAQLLHGQSSSKNYGDYYPMIMVDHKYADFGVSQFYLHFKDIVEFTYDHNA